MSKCSHWVAFGYDNENSYTSQMVRTINIFGKKAASGAAAAENAERPCAKGVELSNTSLRTAN